MVTKTTGTFLDNLNCTQRMIITGHIIKDILQFKTYLCFGMSKNVTNLKINEVAMKRITKMMERHWIFLNLPFETKKYEVKTDECQLYGCEKKYTINTTIAYTKYSNGNKATYCFQCMMNTLKSQKDMLQSSDSTKDPDFTYKCPMKNPINFANCWVATETYINKTLQLRIDIP